MAQRAVALCDGKYIGIESIYTVIYGRQINIPDKIKELRKKSRNNELFCPCGCGSNLILVAGDKNLREQHFRIKDENSRCQVVTEGRTSVDSKIVLKCWLDENLRTEDLETRVPVHAVSNSNRKYEYSFISRNRGIAVNYYYDRANLSDEKLSVLDENSEGLKIYHIVDTKNGCSDGQYPEGLMKVQDRQGYCLLLSIDGLDYDKARLQSFFYAVDSKGLWQEVVFAEAALKEFRITSQNSILFRGNLLESLFKDAKDTFNNKVRKEREWLEEERQRQILRQQLLEEERRRREEEQSRRQKELAELQRINAEKQAEQWRIKIAREQEEKARRKEEFIRSLEESLSQQQTPVRDDEGNRWIKCELCGKIARDSEFSSYGGRGRLNLGKCKECAAKNQGVSHREIQRSSMPAPANDPKICPRCGGKLIKRNGRFREFWGCEKYPECLYTRSITGQKRY